MRRTGNGNVIANVSLATSERYKDKTTGDTREETEWHRIVMFGRLGEIAEQYVSKGRLLYIEGSLRTRKWTDKNGIERYTSEIVANTMKLLYSKDSEKEKSTPEDYARASGRDVNNKPVRPTELDDDIPF